MKSYAGELVCTRRNVSDMEALSNIAVQFGKDMSFEDMADIFTSHFIYADYFKERKNIIVQIAGIIHNKKGA